MGEKEHFVPNFILPILYVYIYTVHCTLYMSVGEGEKYSITTVFFPETACVFTYSIIIGVPIILIKLTKLVGYPAG